MLINLVHRRKLATVAKAKRTAAARLWEEYELAMTTARAKVLAFADALERYLRTTYGAGSWMDRFHAACAAANEYFEAVRAAERYHFGAIPVYTSSHVVNLTGEGLLAVIREIRGTPLPVVVEASGRKVVAYRYADDGIAGFFAVEVRSMRRFGSPRRLPEDWQDAQVGH